jgi:serine/threonine protein kinase
MSETDKLATQWRSISHMLDEALLLPASERGRWLADLPAEHIHLRETLRHFLELQARIEGDDFLESPAAVSWFAAPTPMLSPGDVVGPYRVIEELGTGGMGSVWLAERSDGKPRRRVALKLPRMVWASDLSERMERERDILASLEHPNIARLYDAGLDEKSRPYLAIEYVEGVRITHYCEEHRLDTRRRVELFIQVLAAVQYAHNRLVLHRDLKPGNILVNRNGGVRLLDFGIAKLIEETQPDGEADMITMTRALTPRYASPEQLRSERLTLVSDVYSLGVILHELLTGVSPYPASVKSRAEVELAVIEGVSTPPSRRVATEAGTADLQLSGVRLSRELRGDLDAVMLKSLAVDVSARYASVEALAADLTRWLDGRPVLAVPPSAFVIARKFVMRNRLAVSVATIATLGVLTTSGVAFYQAKKATAESQRAAATRDFLIDMFESANPELHGGREATVRDLLYAATEKLEFAGKRDISLATDTYAAISNVWLKFGDDANAVAALQKRADILSANNAPRTEITARLDEARVAAHSLMVDRLRSALSSEVVREGASEESMAIQADRYWLLGWLSLEDGRIQDARQNFLASNSISNKLGDDIRTTRSYYGFASVSARYSEVEEFRRIIQKGLSQIEKSSLSRWQKIQRRFELISCLALIGDYEHGWPLMSEVFVDSREAFSDWVPSKVEIYSYQIIWAIRVGDISSASAAIKSISFDQIPSSLRKSDLMLAAARFNIKTGTAGESRELVMSALDGYQRGDPQQSYKALAFLSEIAVKTRNYANLREVIQRPEWANPATPRHTIERLMLLEWFKGVERFSERDFASAHTHFHGALTASKTIGPENHPRVSLIRLAIWKSMLVGRETEGRLFDARELLSFEKTIKSTSSSDSEVIKVLRKLKSLIADPQAQEKLRSYPEWEISLL